MPKAMHKGIQIKCNKKGELTYQVSVRIKGHDPVCETFRDLDAAIAFRKDAIKKIRRILAAVANPEASLPESGDFLHERLREAIEMLEPTLPKKGWYRTTLPSLLRVVGNPTIGQLKVSWIKNYILRARKMETNLGIGYAWSTIGKQLAIISKTINWRAENLDMAAPAFVVKHKYYVEAALAEGLTEADLDNSRDRRLEPGEEDALMARMMTIKGRQSKHWPLLTRLAIETGARLQELILADWKEIHPSMEWWDIPAAHTKKKIARTMMLTDGAIDIVKELKRIANPGSAKVFHTMPSTGSISKEFRRYRGEAGLVDYRFHDNRHEGISRFVLTQPDLPFKAVMDMAGHKSIKAFNRYARLRPHELAPLMRRRPKSG